MYLSVLTIENFRCFGAGNDRFEMILEPGLTALVGENDSGKTAVIDALRFALGTSDQEWYRIEDSDFHVDASTQEIRIVCKFEGLSSRDKRAFVEYLTYGTKSDDEPILYVNWTAKKTGMISRGRVLRRAEVRSGKDGVGPSFDSNVRELLRTTYLRPLRDAEQALSAGRGSRLATVLQHSKIFEEGEDSVDGAMEVSNHNLSILGIAKYIEDLLQEQKSIRKTREQVDAQLKKLALSDDSIRSTIKISGADASDEILIRQLLEKLDLTLAGDGKPGLGSNNLLFMACELLLLAEEGGNKLLLIEEPEAHLHAQRQLRAMKFLQKQASDKGVQVIVTTHSPNLASAISLNNIVMIHNKHAYSMGIGETELEKSDYRFLQRFLDVTKANLFFAHGVMIVEGDAENILLPTLARIIGRDFTEHGVSIVNVGNVGLRRYARIFQRKNVGTNGEILVPVACVTDMDVMPDCAPVILGKVESSENWPELSPRKWRAKRDLSNASDFKDHLKKIKVKATGQNVKTFVSDEWTLEYDLALGPKNSDEVFSCELAEDVFVSASLAAKDDKLNAGEKELSEVESSAIIDFKKLKESIVPQDGCTAEEVLASQVYAMFTKSNVSKAIAAQYLAERLLTRCDEGKLSSEQLRSQLPLYLVQAIEYVTRGSTFDDERSKQEDNTDE